MDTLDSERFQMLHVVNNYCVEKTENCHDCCMKFKNL